MFLHALVAVLLWYVVRFFVVYCVCLVYCVFVLWFLCCGMFALVYRKRSWSGFSSRRGEGGKLLDARGDSFQEEGGIADVVESDRVTDVMLLALISGLCLVVFFATTLWLIPSDARKVLCWIICCGLSWKSFLIDNRSFGCVVWRLAIWFNVTLSNSFAGSHQHGRFRVWCNSIYSTGDSVARGDNPTTKTRFRSPRWELWFGGDAVWVKTQIDKQLGEVPKHIWE